MTLSREEVWLRAIISPTTYKIPGITPRNYADDILEAFDKRFPEKCKHPNPKPLNGTSMECIDCGEALEFIDGKVINLGKAREKDKPDVHRLCPQCGKNAYWTSVSDGENIFCTWDCLNTFHFCSWDGLNAFHKEEMKKQQQEQECKHEKEAPKSETVCYQCGTVTKYMFCSKKCAVAWTTHGLALYPGINKETETAKPTLALKTVCEMADRWFLDRELRSKKYFIADEIKAAKKLIAEVLNEIETNEDPMGCEHENITIVERDERNQATHFRCLDCGVLERIE